MLSVVETAASICCTVVHLIKNEPLRKYSDSSKIYIWKIWVQWMRLACDEFAHTVHFARVLVSHPVIIAHDYYSFLLWESILSETANWGTNIINYDWSALDDDRFNDLTFLQNVKRRNDRNNTAWHVWRLK